MLKRRLLSVIALVMALLWLGVRPAHARDVLTWSDFEGALSQCDIVKVEFQHNAVNINQIQIVLNTGPMVHSWKGVGVVPQSGYYEISNGTGPHSMLLTAHTVMTAQSILFGKSGFAGTHNAVYEVQDLSNLQGGDRMTVTWLQDFCPDLRGTTDQSSIPGWLKPGETKSFTLKLWPRTYWSAGELLSIHFAPELGIPQFDIAQNYSYANPVLIPITITAPPTAGAIIKLHFWINQKGGDTEGLIGKWIYVREVAPPTPPPEPPKLVKVPELRGMPLDKARQKLASVDLDIGLIGRDPSLPESAQIVVSQMPGKDVLVLRRGKINVGLSGGSTGPNGYSQLQVVNCASTTVYLWDWNGSFWTKHAPIPPMWGDDKVCPSFSNPPVLVPISAGPRMFVLIDPTRCSTGNNPQDYSCWGASVDVLGDPAGPITNPLRY